MFVRAAQSTLSNDFDVICASGTVRLVDGFGQAPTNGAINPATYTGVGRQRYFDGLALCIAALVDKFEVAIDAPDRTTLCCLAGGGADHHVAITRTLLLGEGAFSALAFSNRSLNAVAGQVSQLVGLHGPTFSLPGREFSIATLRLLRAVIALSGERQALLCGGHLETSIEAAKGLYGEPPWHGSFAYAYLMESAVPSGQPGWQLEPEHIQDADEQGSWAIACEGFSGIRASFRGDEKSFGLVGGCAAAFGLALALAQQTDGQWVCLSDRGRASCAIRYHEGKIK